MTRGIERTFSRPFSETFRISKNEDFSGPYLENENEFLKNSFETVFRASKSCDRDQLVSAFQLTFKNQPSEGSVHEHFKDEIKFVDNRCEVKLPFKEGNDLLPDNYMLTLNRLKSLLKRLRSDPELLKEYDAIMKEQCKLGILEDADPNIPGTIGRIHYLPHHPIIRTDKNTSRVRIVYDASSKATRESLSLNNALYPGPSLIPLILNILIRFRCHKIALTSDIEKAFLMVGVAPEDRDVLRLLWIDDILTDNPTLLKKDSPWSYLGCHRRHFCQVEQ